ncbi:hypothetical protein [Amphibacillus jilinensis]|uniref:hypothetical protein n=1 Tax=Amphibacillus jilinensis TaxID=1216008 RepID=UPI0002EB393C|nr:hypothetical protein [Amphibacillus jilinensis]
MSGTNTSYEPYSTFRLDVIKGDPYLGEMITQTFVQSDNDGNFNAFIETDITWDSSDDYVIAIYYAPTGRLMNWSNTFSIVSPTTYTDKLVYESEEEVLVSGSTTYGPYSQFRLDVIIGDPYSGNIVAQQYLQTDHQGDFLETITVDSFWPTSDNYSVVVYFAPTGRMWSISNTFSIR